MRTQADGTPNPADGKVRTHGAGRQPGLSVVAAGRLKGDASSAWLWADLVHPAAGPVMAVTRVPVTLVAPPRFACAGQRTLTARAPPLA